MKNLIGVVTALFLTASLHALPYVETARLAHSTGAAFDGAANSVAIDGDVAVVGKPINLLAISSKGQAYVFVRSGGVWAEAAQLVPSDGALDDAFGTSVAISGDTIAVGAPGATVDDGANAGKVYVFLKPGGGWAGTVNESARLVNPGHSVPATYLGMSVSTSGVVVAAGAPNSRTGLNAESPGYVLVFVRPDAGWTGTIGDSAVLSSSDGNPGDLLGFSAGLSGDVIVGGAPYANSFEGEGYVWVKPAGGWAGAISESAKLFPASPQFDGLFGMSAAIDGQTVALSDLAGFPAFPQAYVFVEPGGGWSGGLTENADLEPSDGASFSPAENTSVAVSGGRVILGEPGAPSPGNGYTGAAYVFDRPVGGWAGSISNWAKVYPNAQQFSWFGWSAAMSGTRILIGAHAEAVNGNIAQGAAHVFDEGLNPTITVSFSPGSVYTFQPSTMLFLVHNPNTTGILSNISFSDSLPSGLFVDTTPNIATSCNASMTAPPGSSLIVSTGAGMMAGWSCGSNVNVSSGLPGAYTTSTSAVSCDQGCDGSGSSPATLHVNLRATKTRFLVQGPIRVAPGVPVQFSFHVEGIRESTLPLSGEAVVSDEEGHSCVADVSASGDGSCFLTFASPGTFHVRAQYRGNLAFAGSTSPTEIVRASSVAGGP